MESATMFVDRMKKVHEEAEAALRKTQEEMKRYADRGRKETEVWKKGDRVLLSTKDLVFKERPTKKLTERYVVLWQPLDTKSNDHTSNESLRRISSGKFTRELDKEPLLN